MFALLGSAAATLKYSLESTEDERGPFSFTAESIKETFTSKNIKDSKPALKAASLAVFTWILLGVSPIVPEGPIALSLSLVYTQAERVACQWAPVAYVANSSPAFPLIWFCGRYTARMSAWLRRVLTEG